jgi:hypothetical protein
VDRQWQDSLSHFPLRSLQKMQPQILNRWSSRFCLRHQISHPKSQAKNVVWNTLRFILD